MRKREGLWGRAVRDATTRLREKAGIQTGSHKIGDLSMCKLKLDCFECQRRRASFCTFNLQPCSVDAQAMQIYKVYAVNLAFSVIWIELLSAALVIRISKITGNDSSSCRVQNATYPCKSVVFALGALEDTKNHNETNFTFSVEDEVYLLEERVKITQTSTSKSVYLKSSNSPGRSVIRCEDTSAGIEIGTWGINAKKTRNIQFENLEFQNCSGRRFASVVLIWNSVDVNFTNCVFRDNTQAGINAFDSGIAIESCLFLNNTSNGHNSSETYKEGVISAGGGAGFLFHDSTSLSLIIRNSIFESNAAVTNNSLDFIAPSSNVTHFSTGGGGLLVVFRNKARNCEVIIDNTAFTNNTATYGGGLYFADSNLAIRNNLTVTNSNFTRNKAGQTGGGMIISKWDKASKITTIFKSCIVRENESMRGAGINVFLMNYDSEPNDSVLRFDTVTFSNNRGNASSAVRFTTALPYGSTVDVTPEFIDCTVKDHNMSNYAHTSPFTSQRVNLKFMGLNVFQQNYGGGAAAFQDCVVSVDGNMTFANNTGSNGGALSMRSSQIILHPGSELAFVGNKARGLGGAIFVWEHLMSEFIHVNNPDCFLAYSNPLLPPSKWKAIVSFIENSSKLKGAAIYISSLRRCVWKEQPPYHDAQTALRWSSNFVYKNNTLILDGIVKSFTGPEYDIATDTKNYRSTKKDNPPVKIAPGEDFPLNLQAVDELGHEVISIVFVSQVDHVNETSKILLENILYVLSPAGGTIPFSFFESETLYNATKNKKEKRKIQFVDPYSTLTNGYLFEMELQGCHPGFKYSNDSQRCVCNRDKEGVQRCENGRTVYLKEGYWGGLDASGDLVTYYCPFRYCNCTPTPGLPGCLFNPNNSDDQCAKNREGRLCGKCTANTSVGLRWSDCINCEKSGWMLGVVIPTVIGLCVLIIWLNPGISSELRGPLFFFQVLPFIFDPASHLGGHVFLAADIFKFGGPFTFIFRTCIIKGLDNLYAIAFGYMLPFLALLVFFLAYLLSANHCLRFNLRRHSMLQSFWLLLIFVYNYLVETSFLILFCPKVGNEYVFYYDGSQCFHGNHLPIGIIAIFVLVVLVVPPPIVVLLITNGIWRVGPQYVNTLTNNLRPERRWWWSVDLCRRVLVAATYAFIPSWQTKKILMISVCVVILAVHSNCQPYMGARANYVESLYLLVLCALALMQIVDDENVKYKVCLVLLIIASLHTLVVFLCKAVRFFRKRFDCCACSQAPIVERRGYEELEDTQTDTQTDHSLDTTEGERQRSIMDTIYGTSIDDSNDVSS